MKKERSGSTIGEELLDVAMRNSHHHQAVEEMKQIVRCSRKRKVPFGSCVNPKDRRKGKVKKYSQLELALANIFFCLDEQKPGKKTVIGFTDMILETIILWPVFARSLDQGGLIPGDFLHDSQGNIRFAVPWLIVAMKMNYTEQLEKLLKKKIGQITDKDISKNVSSLFSQLFKVFLLLGLAYGEREKVGLRGSYVYRFKKDVHRLTLAQLSYLIGKGRELERKIGRGEIKVEQVPKKKKAGSSSDLTKKVIEIPPDKIRQGIAKRIVEVLNDGTVRITTYFK